MCAMDRLVALQCATISNPSLGARQSTIDIRISPLALLMLACSNNVGWSLLALASLLASLGSPNIFSHRIDSLCSAGSGHWTLIAPTKTARSTTPVTSPLHRSMSRRSPQHQFPSLCFFQGTLESGWGFLMAGLALPPPCLQPGFVTRRFSLETGRGISVQR